MQGSGKRLFLGTVIMGQIIAVAAPTAGRKAQILHNVSFNMGRAFHPSPVQNKSKKIIIRVMVYESLKCASNCTFAEML